MTNEEAANLLKSWRLVAALSQRDVAAKFNKSQAWVSDMENGRHSVTVEVFHQWAAFCGVHVTTHRTFGWSRQHLFNLMYAFGTLEGAELTDVLHHLYHLDATQRRGLYRFIKCVRAVPPLLLEATLMAWESLPSVEPDEDDEESG